MRSWLRHEQQSIRMALATVMHHSYSRVHTESGAPRSQTSATRARGGGERDEEKYTAKFRKTPPSQPELFTLYEEEPGGGRQASLAEPQGAQEQLRRCRVEQIVDMPFCPDLGCGRRPSARPFSLLGGVEEGRGGGGGEEAAGGGGEGEAEAQGSDDCAGGAREDLGGPTS